MFKRLRLLQTLERKSNSRSNKIIIIFSIFIIIIIIIIIFVSQNKAIAASSGAYKITQSYGLQKNGSFHHGVDIAIPKWTEIINQKLGVVTKAENHEIYGLTIIIDYGDFEVLYGHSDKLLVNKGDIVFQGQTISLSGSTGRSSGNHLHVEVRKNGKSVNPFKYLNLQIKEE